MKLLLPYRKI